MVCTSMISFDSIKVANGAVYTRWYYWAIEPRNALGASCSCFLALTGAIQVSNFSFKRKSRYTFLELSFRHIDVISTIKVKNEAGLRDF